ncbi:hypothetical protein PsorP6_017002 [Peronosclerospora sorghi]|uniref:Uncharacterized protein n=1 Tax=Peronosclerospora sorghi TaxID=230839 RepID=A0ACC0WE83_9STRA|nr:hypothetical protein PsorP6_017002 [Peronosclerospora sorghi]
MERLLLGDKHYSEIHTDNAALKLMGNDEPPEMLHINGHDVQHFPSTALWVSDKVFSRAGPKTFADSLAQLLLHKGASGGKGETKNVIAVPLDKSSCSSSPDGASNSGDDGNDFDEAIGNDIDDDFDGAAGSDVDNEAGDRPNAERDGPPLLTELGQTFDDFDEAHKYISTFAERKGFNIKRQRLLRYKATQNTKSMTLACTYDMMDQVEARPLRCISLIS